MCLCVFPDKLKGLGRPVLDILSIFPWGLLVRTDPCWRLILFAWITAWVCVYVWSCVFICIRLCLCLVVCLYCPFYPIPHTSQFSFSYLYILPDNHPSPKTSPANSQLKTVGSIYICHKKTTSCLHLWVTLIAAVKHFKMHTCDHITVAHSSACMSFSALLLGYCLRRITFKALCSKSLTWLPRNQ